MILYIDSVSGISGNMMIGALLDLGASREKLVDMVQGLGLGGFELVFDKRDKNGIMASYFNVLLEEDGHYHHEDKDEGSGGCRAGCNCDDQEETEVVEEPVDKDTCGCGGGGCGGKVEEDHSHDHGHHHHRNLADVNKIIESSSLGSEAMELAKNIFMHIAKSEAKIHGIGLNEVHFHEVGAIDSIIDILGVALLLEDLGIEEVYSSPLTIGQGYVYCAHGLFPLPAPATLDIIAENSIPVSQTGINAELTTPTGAAIVAELANSFDKLEDFTIDKVGYGAGSRDLEIPNVLRLMLVKKN